MGFSRVIATGELVILLGFGTGFQPGTPFWYSLVMEPVTTYLPL